MIFIDKENIMAALKKIRTESLRFRLSKNERKQIEIICELEYLTASEAIRKALHYYTNTFHNNLQVLKSESK